MTRPRRGVALVTTLVLIVLLSAATAVAARGARHAGRLASNAEAAMVARNMAESAVLAVQLGLLLASQGAAAEPTPRRYEVLGKVIEAPPDGRLRRVLTYTQALRGRYR